MRVWELLARSEIVIKGESGAPWLPLERHGQGVKSLSVIYLFNAFVERLLKETYSERSEPIVALEEPEVHLHPQAVRALWSQIDAMPGQKIIASHSPYFIQYVPIRDIRLLRRGADGVQVHFVPDAVSIALPANDGILALAGRSPDQLSYDPQRGRLSTSQTVNENLCRGILRCYTAAEDREHHPAIRDFQERSYALLKDEDLEDLEDWARRIRGRSLLLPVLDTLRRPVRGLPADSAVRRSRISPRCPGSVPDRLSKQWQSPGLCVSCPDLRLPLGASGRRRRSWPEHAFQPEECRIQRAGA